MGNDRQRYGGRRLLPLVLIAALGLGPGAAWGEEPATGVLDADFWAGVLPEWDISGSNTVRAEYYIVEGDETATPYPFEDKQYYDELFLTFSNRVSPFERWRGSFFGIINESDYRSTEDGLFAERFNLIGEKGDAAVPYRAELGDFFGFFSFRTLQRTLKGVQADFQPLGSFAGERHSILLLSGFINPNYRNLDPLEDYYNGASWLVEHDALGRLSLSGIYNFREEDLAAGLPDRHQGVVSLAADRDFRVAGQRLSLEAEIAHFEGDFDLGATTVKDRSETGYFAMLRGRSGIPLTYSFRFENYGQDFRPNGAVITPNRRTWDLRTGWRFANGLRLDGRAQSFTDNLEGAATSQLDTKTVGATLAGPLMLDLVPGLSGRLDAFLQDRESGNDVTDSSTKSATLDLSAPLPLSWVGRLGLAVQVVDNHNTGIKTITRQANVSADHRLELLGLRGVVTPGLLVRGLSGGGTNALELGPSIAVGFAGGGHAVSVNYQLLSQNRRVAGPDDIITHDAALRYSYTIGNHSFGVEGNFQNRDPEFGRNTDSYRISVSWTVNFAKPAQAARVISPIGVAPAAVGAIGFRLSDLPPGTPLDAVESTLTGFGISGGVFQPGVVVYEARVLEDIVERQRLAVVHDQGRVTKSALIIEFDDVGNVDSTAQTFERVREAMLGRYGNPLRTFDEGAFSDDLVADVNTQRFIRIVEWETPRGILRLGIPRRLDRRVRIEVQLAPSFPPPRETLWSIEEVR